MADDLKRTFEALTKEARALAEGAAKTAGEALDATKERYEVSSLKKAVNEAASWTKEQLDSSGASAVALELSAAAGEGLDTVSGKKLLEIVEARLELQARYNDILATKLQEALDRIATLEAVVEKSKR